jgi:Enoyl-(Acyl carrier protein) reductase
MLGGAWWERLEECPRDIGAWATFTADPGFRGVVLLGHSFGAFKVIYSQAQHEDPRVVGLIAMSGTVRAARGIKPERVALAERMVSKGRGLELLPWEEYGSPYGTMSPQSYLSRARANLDVFGIDTPDAAKPRTIETDLFNVRYADSPASRDALLEKIPLKRFGQPEDIAAVAVFLASDLAACVTGQIILVDGGRTYQ